MTMKPPAQEKGSDREATATGASGSTMTTSTATKASCKIREAPAMTTANGIVIGRHLKPAVKAFYHILFAWPQERFKIAIPPEVWTEELVLNLSVSENFGKYSRRWCLQQFSGTVVGSEQCLTLVAYLVESDGAVYRPCLL